MVNEADSRSSSFFVDEAGDLTLFGRRGKSLLGVDGVSKCFMVGVAKIEDVEKLGSELDLLRQNLLADKYLHSIPSMQPERRKTALCFHAKDDCSEVRMHVFKFLEGKSIKVQVGIRRKAELIKDARFAVSIAGKFDENSVYDAMVKTLLKRSLHKSDENLIYFARRGKSTREAALREAIDRAKRNFTRDTGIESRSQTKIMSATPSQQPGLQVIDYFLWAIQRMYERGEDRYFNYLRPQFKLIMDFDDERSGKSYGTWYSDSNPISLEKIKPVTS